MGIEFSAQVSGNGDFRAAITAALQDDVMYEVLPSPRSDTLLLRARGSPPRDQWPQDVEVVFSAAGIHVVFHLGTREEREHLVAVLEDAVRSIGCAATLEEL